MDSFEGNMVYFTLNLVGILEDSKGLLEYWAKE